MQNPLSEYRSGLFATHDNLDESFAYLNSMISTMSMSDQQGINVAVRCLINTLADEIDKVYHPSKNISIESLVTKYLDDVLAERVETIFNDRFTECIDQYMSEEFDITDYDHNIDWDDRIRSNIDEDTLREIVTETIQNNLTFEVRVS
jgi:hypothetical protein